MSIDYRRLSPVTGLHEAAAMSGGIAISGTILYLRSVRIEVGKKFRESKGNCTKINSFDLWSVCNFYQPTKQLQNSFVVGERAEKRVSISTWLK